MVSNLTVRNGPTFYLKIEEWHLSGPNSPAAACVISFPNCLHRSYALAEET